MTAGFVLMLSDSVPPHPVWEEVPALARHCEIQGYTFLLSTKRISPKAYRPGRTPVGLIVNGSLKLIAYAIFEGVEPFSPEFADRRPGIYRGKRPPNARSWIRLSRFRTVNPPSDIGVLGWELASTGTALTSSSVPRGQGGQYFKVRGRFPSDEPSAEVIGERVGGCVETRAGDGSPAPDARALLRPPAVHGQPIANPMGGAPADLDVVARTSARDLFERGLEYARGTRGRWRVRPFEGALGRGGVAQNPPMAVQWWRRAADLGWSEARVYLGLLYNWGPPYMRNPSRALQWYREGAAAGCPRAMSMLAGRERWRRGAEEIRWLEKAAGLGEPHAMEELGYEAENKILRAAWRKRLAEHQEATVELILSQATDEVVGMFDLGVAYSDSCAPFASSGVSDVPRLSGRRWLLLDHEKAVDWWRKAAERDHLGAMVRLGFALGRGRGTRRDDVEAARWYRKAAELGDAHGMCSLAYAFAEGEGVPRDARAAFEWWHRAAAMGHALSMARVGAAYARGEGTSRNTEHAAVWYRKAAVLGNEDAMFELGAAYASGTGILQDRAEAVCWWRRAADLDGLGAFLGSQPALLHLGYAYYSGRWVREDREQAFLCWRGALLGLGGGDWKNCYVNYAMWSSAMADVIEPLELRRAWSWLRLRIAGEEGFPITLGE